MTAVEFNPTRREVQQNPYPYYHRLRDEDDPVGRAIQAGINSGTNKALIFGRNEPAVQNYHRTIARLMQDADAA